MLESCLALRVVSLRIVALVLSQPAQGLILRQFKNV